MNLNREDIDKLIELLFSKDYDNRALGLVLLNSFDCKLYEFIDWFIHRNIEDFRACVTIFNEDIIELYFHTSLSPYLLHNKIIDLHIKLYNTEDLINTIIEIIKNER